MRRRRGRERHPEATGRPGQVGAHLPGAPWFGYPSAGGPALRSQTQWCPPGRRRAPPPGGSSPRICASPRSCRARSGRSARRRV